MPSEHETVFSGFPEYPPENITDLQRYKSAEASRTEISTVYERFSTQIQQIMDGQDQFDPKLVDVGISKDNIDGSWFGGDLGRRQAGFKFMIPEPQFGHPDCLFISYTFNGSVKPAILQKFIYKFDAEGNGRYEHTKQTEPYSRDELTRNGAKHTAGRAVTFQDLRQLDFIYENVRSCLIDRSADLEKVRTQDRPTRISRYLRRLWQRAQTED